MTDLMIPKTEDESKKRFKLGQPVFYCNGYGGPANSKMYRYGTVSIGFITEEEYIPARDTYLYTISNVSPFNKRKVVSRMLGPHFIFEYNPVGYYMALTKIAEFADEVE
jgi:hypothetical protein